MPGKAQEILIAHNAELEDLLAHYVKELPWELGNASGNELRRFAILEHALHKAIQAALEQDGPEEKITLPKRPETWSEKLAERIRGAMSWSKSVLVPKLADKINKHVSAAIGLGEKDKD